MRGRGAHDRPHLARCRSAVARVYPTPPLPDNSLRGIGIPDAERGGRFRDDRERSGAGKPVSLHRFGSRGGVRHGDRIFAVLGPAQSSYGVGVGVHPTLVGPG